MATLSLNSYTLSESKTVPGRSTRSALEIPSRTLFMAVTSDPLLGDSNTHSKMSGRPPPPKDWRPDRVRFPQLESVPGP